MKKILVGFISLAVLGLVFAGGMMANSWLTYNDANVEEANSDVDEIMEILREVNEGKVSAETALAELEQLNPKGLVDKIKKLEKDLSAERNLTEELKQTISGLEADLASANQSKQDLENALASKEQELANKQAEIEAKQQEINQKNTAYDELQRERDAIASERDGYKAELDNTNNYINHLENELTRANEATASHSAKTSEALEEAQSYK